MKTKLILGSLICLSSLGFAQTWAGSANTTGNTNRSGNVGIGPNNASPNSPSYPLDVHTNSPGGQGIRVKQNGASGEASLRLDASGLTAGHHWALHSVGNGYGAFSGSLVFRDETDNAPRIVIAPTTGNVGVGTTVPQRQIHIANTADAALRLDASNWKWDLVSSAGSGQIYSGHFGIFDVTNNAIRLDINQAGYVGIGTNNAEQLLHLKSNADTKLRLHSNVNNGQKWDLISYGGIENYGNFFNSGDFGIADATGTLRLWIDKSGFVHVGKPLLAGNSHFSTAMFTVNGKIVCKELIVTQLNWADFVFDKNYKLMPLNELEKFYQENHHLPEVPSTKEISENGNDLGKTDAILLQKIEELTLYLVEQEKKINALNTEIATLKNNK